MPTPEDGARGEAPSSRWTPCPAPTGGQPVSAALHLPRQRLGSKCVSETGKLARQPGAQRSRSTCIPTGEHNVRPFRQPEDAGGAQAGAAEPGYRFAPGETSRGEARPPLAQGSLAFDRGGRPYFQSRILRCPSLDSSREQTNSASSPRPPNSRVGRDGRLHRRLEDHQPDCQPRSRNIFRRMAFAFQPQRITAVCFEE